MHSNNNSGLHFLKILHCSHFLSRCTQFNQCFTFEIIKLLNYCLLHFLQFEHTSFVPHVVSSCKWVVGKLEADVKEEILPFERQCF